MADIVAGLGGGLWAVFFFIITISVIVTIHEFGHYIVGRWCGIKADVFSVGFGFPLIQGRDRHGTIWQIAAIPMGGYVKFKGDANAASVPTDGTSGSGDTMTGAPLWARTATVAAGPLANFIFSAIVLVFLLVPNGPPLEPYTIENVAPSPVTHDLKPGDQILKIEGFDFTTTESRQESFQKLPPKAQLEYVISRNGQELAVVGPHPSAPLVAGVSFQGAAAESGVQKGDFIQSIDGQMVASFVQIQQKVLASQGETMAVVLWRKGTNVAVELTPEWIEEPAASGGFEKILRIGIQGGAIFELRNETLSILQAISASLGGIYQMILLQLSGFANMITGNISSCNLSGVVEIAQVSGFMASKGAIDYIYLIASISVMIGLVNLLPIPVLDGGHLIFFAYEAITGKPPAEGFLRVVTAMGLSLILTLMLFAQLTDIFC